ncbi:hypothetical protein VTJ04DRAFT_4814 [Mycothermus thermophilus]|uniref:uncharacterized protein n=1 Tax=Humicola insolens TaxID=85995 RepID=UPI0037428938
MFSPRPLTNQPTVHTPRRVAKRHDELGERCNIPPHKHTTRRSVRADALPGSPPPTTAVSTAFSTNIFMPFRG